MLLFKWQTLNKCGFILFDFPSDVCLVFFIHICYNLKMVHVFFSFTLPQIFTSFLFFPFWWFPIIVVWSWFSLHGFFIWWMFEIIVRIVVRCEFWVHLVVWQSLIFVMIEHLVVIFNHMVNSMDKSIIFAIGQLAQFTKYNWVDWLMLF